MLTEILTGAMLLAAVPQNSDTTFAVDPNARLELTNREGTIVVRTWDRDEVSVRTNRSYRGSVEVRRSSGTVHIDVAGGYWDDDDDVDYRLTVPATMSLDLRGSDTDVRVDGTRGEVNIDVHDGDVWLRGGTGRVTIRSHDGDIEAEDLEGRIRIFNMDGDIFVDGAVGDIEAEATDGKITLLNIDAPNVYANTVDGDIWFDGILVPRGSYTLGTHDGDITVQIPEDTDAHVTMATHDGEFISDDFPLTVRRLPMDRRIEFDLGSGGADLRIEAFDGDIELRHRGGWRRR